ncbi:hypothetical protein KUTeg_008748 [Tegillarca granosa]|uniref:Sulfatase N-terminal domain-containing protein n=1 Tax=Tegillarca granosa TaxID=220873 RepID=A0ABQ9FEB3_TEGGR|nr:hypothetical protein KUTeg_008748 [Tegillarca granosa]
MNKYKEDMIPANFPKNDPDSLPTELQRILESRMTLQLVYIFLIYICTFYTGVQGKPPHILFIVADDLGWNDVGFRNPDIKSPNIDKLAREGVILDQAYVQPVCSPSRNAFMSGMYPFKSGLQLKQLGYATHMIGKWHLGMCKWECTPTYRGFDTFYGYYNGAEDYYNYTYLYTLRAEQLIIQHDKSKPFFFKKKKRKKNIHVYILGMVTAMDDAIGDIINILKQTGMYNETLIVFTADNGGWPQFFGNNYPLRGSKLTVYEGGTRASAFIHGTMLKKTGYTYIPGIDGVNQWPSLLNGSESKRTEFIYNLDDKLLPLNGHAAIRSGNYKLIQDDPNEHEDLSLKEREILKQLLAKMDKYKEDMVPANFTKNDPNSLPSNYNGFWSPGWC